MCYDNIINEYCDSPKIGVTWSSVDCTWTP